jgi:hypothetical protein
MQLWRVDTEDAVLRTVARAQRVAVDRDDLHARSEGWGLVAAIALDQEGDDDEEHERRELAELLRQGPRLLCIGLRFLAVAIDHACARLMPARMRSIASAGSVQRNTFTHLPCSRSL